MQYRVFVSYRRATAGEAARSIALALGATFGRDRVFIDLDGLEHGERFDLGLAEALAEAEALAVVIDPTWAQVDSVAMARLGAPTDFVGREIASFLEAGKPIVPILFGEGAAMPREASWPAPLRPVARLQAVRVRLDAFDRDLAELAATLRRSTRGRRRADGLLRIGAAALAVGGLAAGAWYAWDGAPWTAGASRPLSAAEAAALRIGETFVECGRCPTMVTLPAGQFTLGSPEDETGAWRDGRERPRVAAAIPARFAMARTEVTRAEFEAFLAATDRAPPPSGCRSHREGRAMARSDVGFADPGFEQSAEAPALCVGWEDARAYARWLSAETDAVYRLPSEAEWEFAARAGRSEPFSFGATWALLCEHGNVYDAAAGERWGGDTLCRDGHVYPAPVGRFAPNAFGLYDMHGNLWEWVEDCWRPDHSANPGSGQAVETGDCAARVIKGGDWIGVPAYARSASRHFYGRTARGDNVGFRVVRELD